MRKYLITLTLLFIFSAGLQARAEHDTSSFAQLLADNGITRSQKEKQFSGAVQKAFVDCYHVLVDQDVLLWQDFLSLWTPLLKDGRAVDRSEIAAFNSRVELSAEQKKYIQAFMRLVQKDSWRRFVPSWSTKEWLGGTAALTGVIVACAAWYRSRVDSSTKKQDAEAPNDPVLTPAPVSISPQPTPAPSVEPEFVRSNVTPEMEDAIKK